MSVMCVGSHTAKLVSRFTYLFASVFVADGAENVSNAVVVAFLLLLNKPLDSESGLNAVRLWRRR